jgi:exodeoxyribonuclease-3
VARSPVSPRKNIAGRGRAHGAVSDFNVVSTNADIYNWWLWQNDAVLQPQTREAWQDFVAQG